MKRKKFIKTLMGDGMTRDAALSLDKTAQEARCEYSKVAQDPLPYLRRLAKAVSG